MVNLAKIISKAFNTKVFINVELMGEPPLPHYYDGGKWVYCGASDAVCDTIYIRQLEDMQTVDVDAGGCGIGYNIIDRVRLVIFLRDNKVSDVIAKVTKLVTSKDMRIKSIITNKQKISNVECNGAYIDEKNKYIAFNINLIDNLCPCCSLNNSECETKNNIIC